MMSVRVWRPGRVAVDGTVSVAAALVTAAGSTDRVAAWLPRSVIVPLALGQGLLLLARRRAPMAVLAANTLIGAFLLAVGYPAGAMHRRRAAVRHWPWACIATPALGRNSLRPMRAAAHALLAGIALLIARAAFRRPQRGA